MSLKDAAERVAVTSGPAEVSEVTEDEQGKHFNFVRHRPITLDDARAWIRSTGDNPDLYNISIRAIAYGIDSTSNKMAAWPKTGLALAQVAPLAEMYREARKRPRVPRPLSTSGRATVVVASDWQIGKTGHRGGTPELLDRLEESRRELAVQLRRRKPEAVLLLDGGDGIENFESGGNPMFTNDLSLPDQLDCYATELLKFVKLCASFGPLEVGVVPSNHAAWRRGKQVLGKPGDDFGIFTHRQVAKVAAGTWHYPDEWDESLCVDFLGTPIGLAHGHQFAPGRAIDWWQGQSFGDQAVARADVLVTGHYHTFGSLVAGQSPFTHRERMWLGAPTIDSGSDWYRNVKGRDSQPGTLIFDVTPDGFDLGSLIVI